MDQFRRRAAALRDEWRERGTQYEIAKALTAPARRLLVRLRVEGVEHLPVDGPAIVAANHLSFFDSVLLMFSLPRQVCMLGKAEYTDRWLTRWLFCGAGMIPVRRENPGDTAHALDQVRAVLEGGNAVGVFPEGTRSRDGKLHKGHSGAAHLALVTGAPLVPVGLEGTDGILPSGKRIVRPFRTATVRIGRPIDPAAMGFTRSTNRARREITAELMKRIRILSHQPYVDEYAPIPGHTHIQPAATG
jgi:1-acyl-sn-glycerol-3-phosphate acyltransferase